jgi:preprotein translocase subunit SecG
LSSFLARTAKISCFSFFLLSLLDRVLHHHKEKKTSSQEKETKTPFGRLFIFIGRFDHRKVKKRKKDNEQQQNKTKKASSSSVLRGERAGKREEIKGAK